MSARNNIDSRAAAAMMMICAIWGLQQVAIKAAEPDISAVLQIAIRSGIAALAVYLLARYRSEKFVSDRSTLLAGLCVGGLFALEFFFVSEGLRYTSASHMAVFLYTAPLFSAIGLHFVIRHERLSLIQWAGIAIAFGGVVLAISGMSGSSGAESQLRGDIRPAGGNVLGRFDHRHSHHRAGKLLVKTDPVVPALGCLHSAISVGANHKERSFHFECCGLEQPDIPNGSGLFYQLFDLVFFAASLSGILVGYLDFYDAHFWYFSRGSDIGGAVAD